jgi:hypothetical protein
MGYRREDVKQTCHLCIVLMNCQFCQKECFISDSKPHPPSTDMWECYDCHAWHSTTKEGSLMLVSWKVKFDSKEYFIKSYDGCTGNAPEFVIYYYTTSESGKHYWEEVKRFDFVPKDWTPLNSAHKLKTYLPFL